jgi:molybdopterin-guanine dinucleotide biosynthesis protein A
MTLGGAILVGGASRRMGTPKHAVRLADGRTMLEAVATALQRVCNVLAIVGLHDPPSAFAVREQFPAAALIHDIRPREGPLAGMEALLSTSLADAYIVCSCDMPMLSPEVMEALAAPCDEPTAVLHVEGEMRWRPLPCRVRSGALPTVQKLLSEGRRAVHELHSAVGARVIQVPANWAAALTDINTPSDLASADAQHASTPAHQAKKIRSVPVAEIVTARAQNARQRRPR